MQHHTFRHTGTHVRQPKLAKNVEALQQNGGWLLLLYVLVDNLKCDLQNARDSAMLYNKCPMTWSGTNCDRIDSVATTLNTSSKQCNEGVLYIEQRTSTHMMRVRSYQCGWHCRAIAFALIVILHRTALGKTVNREVPFQTTAS